MAKKKRCIVNYSSHGWYLKGSERLKKRLEDVQYDGDTIINIGKLPRFCKQHSEIPYMFKPYMILTALQEGYDQIVWMDCSVYPNKNIEPLFEIIDEQGYLILKDGWNSGQWCADSALEPLGISREESFDIPHCLSGLFAFDFTNKKSTEVFWKFIDCSEKAFPGEWKNTGLASKDTRVLGHRHDQTALSVLAYKNNWKFTNCNENNLVHYGKNDQYTINFIPA